MKNIWKIVALFCGIVFLLGAICVGVAFISGTDVNRVSELFVSAFNIDEALSQVRDVLASMPN